MRELAELVFSENVTGYAPCDVVRANGLLVSSVDIKIENVRIMTLSDSLMWYLHDLIN